MHPDTLGTEAIRAFFTVQCCWLNNEEIYLEKRLFTLRFCRDLSHLLYQSTYSKIDVGVY